MATAEPGGGGFLPGDLAILRAEPEVQIETRRDDHGPAHLTTIWVVVDRLDRVLVRTYRGPGSRWYREALGRGHARLHSGELDLDVVVRHATDPGRIQACSDGLRRKYAGDPATAAMVADDVLGTTLELTPA